MAIYNGTSGNDNYAGGPAADTVSGYGGADSLRGGGGADRLSGYIVGVNELRDDGAIDRLFGEGGDDYLALSFGDIGDGGAGNDTLVAGGAGTFTGGTGNDVLRVGDNVDIAASVISGIERLEVTNGPNGSQMTATELSSFGTIAGLNGIREVHFRLTGAGTGTATIDTSVQRVTIDGSNATDSVTLVTASAVGILSGYGGADSLRGGGGADRLSGYIVGVNELRDDGAIDRLFGEGGDDYLALSFGDIGDGGAGNDTLVAGGAGTFTGGTGNDVLRVGDNVDIAASVISGIERLEVTNGPNGSQMTATELSSFGTIAGLNGIREVHFRLTGAGTGTATIDTSVQRVTIDGSNATDSVTLVTASAVGILSGYGGADSLRGGGGADRLSGYIVGVNELRDDGAIDRLFGEGGDDYLALSLGDIGDGGAGNDTLVAGGAATLRGGDGNDLLVSSIGNDSLEGGLGVDTASYGSASQPVIVSLVTTAAQVTGGGGTDVLSGIENLIGGSNNDRLTGNAGDNVVEGGFGNDTLAGGTGADTASYARATAALVVDLRSTNPQNTLGAGTDQLSGFENLTGGAGNDTLTGTTGANVIEGGDGNDSLVGLGGRDTASYESAGAGVTVSLAISIAQATRGAGSDLLSGFENLRGSRFGDNLIGDATSNAIEGLNGNDTLTGGGGNDTLIGGAGADQLRGGTGSDIFRVDLVTDSSQAARDAVLDFEGVGVIMSDRVDLSRIDADTAAAGNQAFTFGSRGIHGLFLSNQGTDTLVQGNTDADADFEFALLIRDGTTLAAAYIASDFIL